MAGPLVACPTCKRDSLFAPSNPWRPFCSERCRRTDLGAWASEQFRVAAAEAPDDDALLGESGQPKHPGTGQH